MGIQLVIDNTNPSRKLAKPRKRAATPAPAANPAWATAATTRQTELPTVGSIMRELLASKVKGYTINDILRHIEEHTTPKGWEDETEYLSTACVLQKESNLGVEYDDDYAPVGVTPYFLSPAFTPNICFAQAFPRLAYGADIFVGHGGCTSHGQPLHAVATPAAVYFPGKMPTRGPDLTDYRFIAKTILTTRVGGISVLEAFKVVATVQLGWPLVERPDNTPDAYDVLEYCGLEFKRGDKHLPQHIPLGLALKSKRRFKAAFPGLPEHAAALLQQHVRIQATGEPALRIPKAKVEVA